jgi:hypothetical protein
MEIEKKKRKVRDNCLLLMVGGGEIWIYCHCHPIKDNLVES